MDNTNTTPITDPTWNGNGNGNGTDVMDKARQGTSQLVHQAQAKAGEMMGLAGDQVKTQLSSQKDRATDGLQGIVEVIRQTGQSLKDQNYDSAGHLADSAAEQIERISGYLKEHDVEQIVGEVQNFARSQPAVILGATFALGFLAARLVKNADTGRGASEGSQGYYPSPSYESSGSYSGGTSGPYSGF